MEAKFKFYGKYIMGLCVLTLCAFGPVNGDSISSEQCDLIIDYMNTIEDITRHDFDPVSRRESYNGALERLEFRLKTLRSGPDHETIKTIIGLATSYKDWASIYATLAQQGRKTSQAFDRMALARERLLIDCPQESGKASGPTH